MRIVSSNVALTGQHSLLEQDTMRETLQLWHGRRPAANSRGLLGSLVQKANGDSAEISAKARALLQAKLREINGTDDRKKAGSLLSDADKAKITLIEKLLSALTGKKIKIRTIDPGNFKIDPAKLEQIKAARFANSGPALTDWGLAYDIDQLHLEQEQTAFSAAGVVKTADGKEIDFNLAVTMSRQFMSEQNLSIRAGDALCDPLVINFDAPAASLTQTKYSFDLDSDGQKEQISFAGAGSGFLALDKNGDGKVSDGGELFGPQGGNGFAELAAYDSDGNKWIDENDAIFDKLRIWTKDENGNDQLLALGQKGIGAIYLGNIGTEFSYKDGADNLEGQLRTSGVFLREDGTAGSVQQIDLAI